MQGSLHAQWRGCPPGGHLGQGEGRWVVWSWVRSAWWAGGPGKMAASPIPERVMLSEPFSGI